MKKILFALIAIALAAALSSCALSGLGQLFGETPLTRLDDPYALSPSEDATPMNLQTSAGTEYGIDIPGGITLPAADWPDNEFTKQIPKPEFALLSAETGEHGFTAVFSGVGADQMKAYAGKVKAAGFDVDPEETDENVMGMAVYSYSASNGKGYSVSVSFTAGVGGVTVTCPPPSDE